MEQNKVNMWLSMNADKFRQQDLMYIQNVLAAMPGEQIIYLQGAEFQKPSTIFLIAFFLGWERFFLDNIGLGILKVITGYGCGIWWLIDIFTAKKRAQKYNFQQFQKATALVGGGTSTSSLASITTIPKVQQTTTKPERYEFGVIPTVQSKGNSGGKIALIIVAAVVLVVGLFAFLNWDSVSEALGIESGDPNATERMNLINSQMGGTNSTTPSTLKDIFSESQKARKAVKEPIVAAKVVTEERPRTEQRRSTSSENQAYSGSNNSSYSLAGYLLTENDLRGLSKRDLRILRNEIYARHGYIFKSQDLREYFSAQDWYEAKYSDVSRMLNSIERQNVEFIKRHE